MKRVVKKSFLLLILGLLVLLLVNFVSAEVIINEIMYNPDQCSDSYCEWIEIYNNGTSPLDLTNYTLCSDSLLKGYIHTNLSTLLNTTFILNVSSYALITDGSSGTGVYDNFSVNANSLALHVDAASLCGGLTATSVMNISNETYTQSVNYTSFATLFPGTNNQGKTLIWYKNNWTESALENGTPGASNDQFAPDFNKWVTPASNNSYIAGLYNVTVNITDETNVNTTLIDINGTNHTMSRYGNLFYYLWDTTAFNEAPYNLTVYSSDSLKYNNSDVLSSVTVDNTNPNILNPSTTANSRNFVSPGFMFNASVNATDTNLLNVTCTLSSTTVGNFSVEGDIHKCNLTAPLTEGDSEITLTAIDKAGNSNTTTINFTTKYSTSANLTTQDITVSGLNQSDKVVEVNVTFNNKGSSTIYNPNIILDSFSTSFAQATNKENITCAANLSASQSCSAIFNVTIFGGGSTGDYTIFWNANWTDNNESSHELAQAARSYVTISSNPQITAAENRSATIEHNTNQTITVSINSTGNTNLQNVNIAFTPSTLQQSWVNISPSSFSSISAAANETFNVTVAIPKYTNAGNYTGNLTITSTGAEAKTILLRIVVPQDSSWTSYPTGITAYKKTSSAGLLGTIYINNSGNIGQLYNFTPSGSLYFYVWNNSNPSSQYVEKGTTQAVNFYHLANGPLDSYIATLTITSYNTSGVNYTYFNLTRDDNNPNMSIASPSNNSFVKGIVDFNVSADDLNLSRIEYYVGNSLVFNGTGINYTYDLNTSAYSDNIYTLKAIAYDTAGNYNTSEINVTVNNTDDSPVLKANIPTINWTEDSVTTFNLSNYFKSIDNDTLRYNFTAVNNITIHINNNTNIANFTPDANFSGIRYTIFYAMDSNNNLTASNNVTLNVTNVNDAPTIPALSSPVNNTNVTSATGKARLAWSASIDADSDTVTYYVYLSKNSSNMSINTTTVNNYYEFNNLLNNVTYYWKIKAGDSTVNTSKTNVRQFTVLTDTAPTIDSWQWNNTLTSSSSNTTPRIQENKTISFKVSASDAENNSINYTWYLNSAQFSAVQNYTFNFTDNLTSAGVHNITLIVQDNNSNAVSQQWTLTITDLNRQPTITQLPNQAIVEDSVNNAPINLSIYFTDSDTDNTLTFLVQYQNTSEVTCAVASNNLTLTPAANFTGNGTNAANCSIVAYDGTENSTINSFRINVSNVNDKPVLTPIGSLTANQGTLFSYDANATDADSGDTLTFSDNSTLFNINASTGKFNFTPTNAQVGAYKINITVKDGSNTQDSEIITLTISNINDAPVLDAISPKTAVEDSQLKFNITASDLDNNSLTFTSNITSITFTNAANNSLAIVSWTPTNSYVGNNTANITVSDGSLTDSQLVTITVTNTNDAPSITAYYPANLNPRISAGTGTQLFNITASDPDTSDTITRTWFRNNAQVATGTSYTASGLGVGIYNITAKVNDTSGNATQQEWLLNVTTNIVSNLYSGSILSHNTTEENASAISVNESTYGSIGFLVTVNLSNATNIDDYLNISKGVVSIDKNILKGLNRSASVIMKGLNYTKTPLIYYNSGFNVIAGGTICNPSTTPACTNIIYDSTNGILKFNVEHFSTYYSGTNTTNGASEITSTPKTNATAREAYSYEVDATDPDSDTLTYSLTSSPNGMSIISSTGAISWTPTNSQVGMHNIIIRVSDGSLTDNQTFNISVAEAKKLRIKSLDVKVDSKSDKDVTDEDTIKREAEPESDIEFKVEVESGFSDEDDLKIEDIIVEVTIRDIDDGDDLDEESKEFDLRPERDKKVTLKFKVPLEVDEDTYDVDIHVEGEDENGTMHEIDWTIYLEVEKDKHNLRIIKAALSPAVIKCQKTVALNTEIINLGREDEDEVVLEITSHDLVSFRKENIELDEGIDNSRYSNSLKIAIPDDLGIGTYPIEINAYYDATSLSDTETVNLEVQECKVAKKEKEKVKAEPIVVVNKTQPAPTQEPKKEEVTKITFRESPAYMAFLALSFVVLSGLVVFVLGVTIVLLKKK